ncbi:MAG: hypothetical protein Q4G26_00750 [Paracoccus sp. (in: a-proteobacteria)]|nr:hypothetical protein [Paracoccus sp. (in: a-proteobacteria)]
MISLQPRIIMLPAGSGPWPGGESARCHPDVKRAARGARGIGLTLGLRLFSHQRIVRELTAAGFTDIQAHTGNLPRGRHPAGKLVARMVMARAQGQLPAPPRGFLARLMGRA